MPREGRRIASTPPATATNGRGTQSSRNEGTRRRGWATEVSEVTHPVESMVHDSMRDGWRINKENDMWFIFDVIKPCMEFKSDMPFDPTKDYPALDPTKPDLIMGDDWGDGFMPYEPVAYQMKYRIRCDIRPESFMDWWVGELRTFQLGSIGHGHRIRTPNEVKLEDFQILAPYDRIISQLVAEDLHGEVDRSLDARRRQSYARRVLDEFAEEYIEYWSSEGDPAHFWSKVLSPILVRQLRGVSDHYSWPVADTVSLGRDTVDIRDATRFYLSVNPADPGLIPRYRTSLVGIGEARWHLATVMGILQVGAADAYDKVGDNQAKLEESVWQEYLHHGRQEGVGVPPPLRDIEVRVIVDEGLEAFFAMELTKVPGLLAAARSSRAAGSNNSEEPS